MSRQQTPQELEGLGVSLIDVPWDPIWRPDDARSEYWRRIKERLPLHPPKYRVGDWAYNHLVKQNQRIVTVYWSPATTCGLSQWRYSMPGFTTGDAYGPFDGAPFVEYVETGPGSNCWREVTS